MRRVLKAEWIEEREYYCLALECGHHAHASAPFLRAEFMCPTCLREKLTGETGPGADPVRCHAAQESKYDTVYDWQPGMPQRWYVTTMRVLGGGLHHVIGKQERGGWCYPLCGTRVTGREVPTDGGKPCGRCLEKAAYLEGRAAR